MLFELYLMALVSGVRTESPDNDSAFSDNVSMLSSESSASSGGSGGRNDPGGKSSGLNLAPSPTQVNNKYNPWVVVLD
jgi:amyloid beta A4 precursor protein-binding family B protein 1-interacting protein